MKTVEDITNNYHKEHTALLIKTNTELASYYIRNIEWKPEFFQKVNESLVLPDYISDAELPKDYKNLLSVLSDFADIVNSFGVGSLPMSVLKMAQDNFKQNIKKEGK